MRGEGGGRSTSTASSRWEFSAENVRERLDCSWSMEAQVSEPYRMRSGREIVESLDKAARGVQAASEELSKLSQEFFEDGGIGLSFEVAVDEEKLRLYDDAVEEGLRPPPADIRQIKAERAVRAQDPQRWAEYQAKKARIDALKLWLTSLKAAISANQSLRKEMGDNL